MRRIWCELLQALFIGAILPAILLSTVIWSLGGGKVPPIEREAVLPEQTVSFDTGNPSLLTVNVRDANSGITQMNTDSYLVGVMLGEMPADFEIEALKAQAIAARTYAQKAWFTGGKHGDKSVCTDPSCCQAYISEESYLQRGGSMQSVEKMREAVESTSGYVLTYEGSLIEATYFSCSGGMTEDAQAVWGTDIPYLRATDSPGEEKAAIYNETKQFASLEFSEKIGRDLAGDPSEWIGKVTYTPGGGIDTVCIGNVEYSGQEIRRKFGLKSTVFQIHTGDGKITIFSQGYGHRVGMSQYGADAMAAAGSSCQEILAHYYPGTVLQKMSKPSSGD